MGKVILYGILAERAGIKEIEVKTSERTLEEVLKEVSDKYNLKELLFREGKIRPIYLIMVDGKDYLSLGLLKSKLEDEKEIRVIPIYHGGQI